MKLQTMTRILTVATLIAVASAYEQVPGVGATPKPTVPNSKPVRTCESLVLLALPNTTIESAAVDPANPGLCRVTAVTTHPPAGDKVKIWIGIPTAIWNGRFLGIGGGRFAGASVGGITQPLALGYASGSTDTGHEGGSGSFALDANGRLNWQLIRDNALVGIHGMTVAGKAFTQAMYGVAPCKLAAATAAAITACDAVDGVKDDVIEDPKRCNYDPS
jgi:hypothetical protein